MIECDKIIVTCRQAAGQTSVTLTRRERCEEMEEREHQRGEVAAFLRCHATLTTARPSPLPRLHAASVACRHLFIYFCSLKDLIKSFFAGGEGGRGREMSKLSIFCSFVLKHSSSNWPLMV